MQSQYGEMQQFMADGGCSPVFSIGTADMQSASQAQKQQHHHHLQQQQQQAQRQQQLHHHQHLHLHHHHLPQMQLQQPVALPPPQAAFQHFHPIPVTQQLFQHGPQFQLFQQEQQRRIHQQLVHLGLEIESGPESSSSPTRSIIPGAAAAGSGGGGTTMPSFLGGASFKLAINESNGGGDSRDRLNDDEGILQGDEGSDTHIHLWNTTREEEPGIKEPFWRPLDVDYINRNNKRCKEKQAEPADRGKHCKSGREGENVVDDGNNSASNYKLFSELEAIYKPVGGGGGGDGSGSSSRAVLNNNVQQTTGSGSALTGENPQATAAEPQGADWGHTTEVDADQGSVDTSTGGEEAAQIAEKPNKSSGGSSVRKKKRKQQLSSIAAFFENLVKRLMEHQEGLHHKFLEVLDRRDQERISREELWRQQEAAKTSREATARAQEQALASTREAAIISFLEKITGESLNLPTREQFQSQLMVLPEESSQKEGAAPPKHADQPDAAAPVDGSDADVNPNSGNADPSGAVNPSRWPKAEVQALIRVRSSLEARFQEPGLKGPLWEEVSAAMGSIGYQRSAKRCKEKWENINKYFRKTKDSPKKRSQHSKTCPYFHQLDQLYSRTATQQAAGAAATPSSGRRSSSELLDALMVVPNDLQAPISLLTFPDVDAARQSGCSKGVDVEDNHEGSGSATPGRRDMDDGDEDGEGDEEGEGDSQEPAARSRGRDDGGPAHHDHSPRDVAVFFRRRLES